MLTGGAPGEGSAAIRHSTAARFQSPKSIRVALEHANSAGIHACVTIGDQRIFSAIGKKIDSSIPSIYPIVPNIQGFMREAVEHGMIGAGWQRVRRMGLPSLLGLGFRGASRAIPILHRDFPTLLLCFIELELADFRRYDPQYVFLQPQMTDLALAMNNPRILESFLRAAQNLTSARAGFMTQNFTSLIERCRAWGIEPAAIIAPWKSTGASMRPTQTTCEQTATQTNSQVWSDRAGWVESPSPLDREYFNRTKVAGALRDDDVALGLTNS